MDNQNLLYQIGMTLIKGIGTVTAKQIIETLGDASLLFKEKKSVLERIPGISRRVIAEIHRSEILQQAEKELSFIEKNKIQPFFIGDESYPTRLKECIDAPVLLYFRGNANLNAEKIISVVGTRNVSNYGKEITEKIIQDISEIYPKLLIVSGLAYGVDVCAHKTALKHHLPTLGVLAHGLDRIYPHIHRTIAIEMLSNGGLLTDFLSGTNPDRQNFIKRNRIVAGLSDCTLVVESAEKGGALITAGIADSYHRDVFAVPGKATDIYSSGCNALIKYKKAALVTCAEDIFREMCWNEAKKDEKKPIQRKIFVDLTPEEQTLVDLLSQIPDLQLNTIAIKLDVPIYKLTSLLFELEMKGVVRCLPGGIYQLLS